MKKILFAAIAVCGFVAANAQFNTESSSTAPGTKAGPVTSEFNLRLKVHNVIRIWPNQNLDMFATFNSARDLDGSQYLNLAIPDLFVVSSNRKFSVGMTAGNVEVTGNVGGKAGNSNMPLSVFSFNSLTAPGSGVALASDGWQTLAASQELVSCGDAGARRAFGVQFKAKPGWDYEGGYYTVPITVTATQL